MDLHLTSEQTLLRDSAAKFTRQAGPKVARGFRDRNPSFAPARLREAGELGWLGLLVPETAGGHGLGLFEMALVLQQVGRDLVCEPIGLAMENFDATGAWPQERVPASPCIGCFQNRLRGVRVSSSLALAPHSRFSEGSR